MRVASLAKNRVERGLRSITCGGREARQREEAVAAEAVADGGGKVVGRRRGKECVCMLPCVNGDGDGGGRYTMY